MFIAYKYVAATIMLAQVNYYAPRLHLRVRVPLKQQDISYMFIGSPIFHKLRGAVRMDGGSYGFYFLGGGGYKILKMDGYGYKSFGIPVDRTEATSSIMERACRMKYAVTTNDVYPLATNWLAACDIDLPKIEKEAPHHLNTSDLMFYSNRGPVPNPLLYIDWNDPRDPINDPSGVSVEISAVTGEFLELSDWKNKFDKNPVPGIRNFDLLAAIPDDVFLKYSDIERSNLVAQSILNLPLPRAFAAARELRFAPFTTNTNSAVIITNTAKPTAQ